MEAVKRKRKPSILDPYRDEIMDMVEKGVSVSSISKLINPRLPDYAKMSYNGFLVYVNRVKGVKNEA